jgi:Protein of unknown function (DUF2637)
MWSNLPSHLRTGLGAALLLVIGVAVASFTLSFIALREVASNPAFGWGRNAWIFPACVDMALVACEVVYVSVSMIRGVNPALPFCLMVAFGAATVWFNVERVPAQWRMVTAIPPLAGIFMTLLIAFLLKVFARITGKAWHHEAPPLAYGSLGAPGSPIQGAVWRPDAMPGSPFPGYGAGTYPPSGAFGQVPSSGQPGIPQIGQAEMPEEAKRRVVEMYLSGLSAEQLGVATGSSVVVGVAALGMAIDERYARRILDEYKAAQKSRNGARTSVRRKA